METSFLSRASRTGLTAIKSFNEQFSRTSERLATGRKVNRTQDNPAAFFTAKSLSDRAGDLNRVLDAIGTSLGTVRAAEAGVRALQGLVQLGQSIVNAAAALPEANPTATGSTDVSGEADLAALAGVSDGDQFSVQVGSGAAVTVTISSGESVDTLLAELNAIDNVSATLTDAGTLQVQSTNGEDLVLAETSGTPLAGLGLAPGAYDRSTGVSPERAAKAAEFDAVLAQISQIAGDASYLGVNLLAGNAATIAFNPSGASSLTISGADSSAPGLGISGAANGFATNADLAGARASLNGALGSLRSFSSGLSSELSVVETRRSFTSQLRNVLQAGAGGLTLADPNEEGAALLALQTRSSIAHAGYSIVQDSERGVLRLFA